MYATLALSDLVRLCYALTRAIPWHRGVLLTAPADRNVVGREDRSWRVAAIPPKIKLRIKAGQDLFLKICPVELITRSPPWPGCDRAGLIRSKRNGTTPTATTIRLFIPVLFRLINRAKTVVKDKCPTIFDFSPLPVTLMELRFSRFCIPYTVGC